MLHSPPSLEEIQRRFLEVALKEPMDTLNPRGNYITKMRVLINPSLHQLFLVRIEPIGLDIANLFNVLR
jgi:hypothetical protein